MRAVVWVALGLVLVVVPPASATCHVPDFTCDLDIPQPTDLAAEEATFGPIVVMVGDVAATISFHRAGDTSEPGRDYDIPAFAGGQSGRAHIHFQADPDEQSDFTFYSAEIGGGFGVAWEPTTRWTTTLNETGAAHADFGFSIADGTNVPHYHIDLTLGAHVNATGEDSDWAQQHVLLPGGGSGSQAQRAPAAAIVAPAVVVAGLVARRRAAAHF